MAKKSAKELKEEGAQLGALIAKARKKPHNFALVIAKDDGIVLEADPRKASSVMLRQAKSNGGTAKGVMGVMSVKGKVIQFSVEDPDGPPKVLLMQTKKHLKDRGLAFKVAFLLPGGDAIGDEDDEAEDVARKPKKGKETTESAKDGKSASDATDKSSGGVEKTETQVAEGDSDAPENRVEKPDVDADAAKPTAGGDTAPAGPDRTLVEETFAKIGDKLTRLSTEGEDGVAKKAKQYETAFTMFLNAGNIKKAQGLLNLATSFIEKEYARLEEQVPTVMSDLSDIASSAAEAVSDAYDTVVDTVDDFVDGLTEGGRKKLELQRLGVSEEEQDHIVGDLESNPNALVDAKRNLVDGMDLPEDAKGPFKDLAEQDPAAFEEAYKQVKTLRDDGSFGAPIDPGEGAAAAGDEAQTLFANLVAGMEDPEEILTEIERLKNAFDDASPALPDKVGQAQKYYSDAKKALSDDDIDGAKTHAEELANLVGEAEARLAALIKAKEELLAAIEGFQAPAGAIDEERAQMDEHRKTAIAALEPAAPSLEDIHKAQEAFAQMVALIPIIYAAIYLREAVAEIMEQRSHQLREIARLLSRPGNTVKGEQLQRRLDFQSEEIVRLCTALKPVEARKLLAQMLGTIAELQAEEPIMAAADALREEAEREYAALKPKIDRAKLFYPIDEEFKAMVEEFREEDVEVRSLIHKNHFGHALVVIDSLKRSIDRLLARQADFDARVAVRDTFVVDWEKYEVVRSQVYAMRITLPDVRALFVTFDAADDVVLAAKNDFDYPAAQAAIPAAKTAAEAVLKRKKDCDVHAAKYDEAMTRFAAGETLFKPMNAIDTIHTEALWNKLAEGVQKRTAFWQAVRDTPDMAKALKIVAEFEKIVQDLLPLLAAEKAAVIEIDRLNALLAAAKAKIDAADGVKPNTEAMLTIFKAYVTARYDFFGSLDAAKPDAEAKLNAYIAAAEAVTNAAAAHAGHEAAAKAACDAREAAVKPKFEAAKTACEPYPTELGSQVLSLEDTGRYYQKLYDDQRYLEARDYLADVEKFAEDLLNEVAAAKALVDQREAELTGKYTAAFIARLTTVTGYDDSSKEMREKRKSAIDLQTSLETAQTDRKLKEALEHFAALDPLVTDLEALKAAEGPLLADRLWVETQVAAKQHFINTARVIEGVDRATQAKVDAFTDARKGFRTPYKAADFTAARAAWPRFDKAIDDLNAMQGAYDALRGKKDICDAAWAAISSKYDVVYEMRGLTEELEKLVKDFDTANALYDKAYDRHDWDQVLVELPNLERAINALLAKKADHDAADAAGAETADETLYELKTMFVADLKAKTAEEKLELLEKLRSQKQELTPEQLAMQRKIYESFEMDAEFVKQDDERRAKLNEAIKKDAELQAASANWDSTDPKTMISPDEKIRLLMKTVKKECEIYGMPVPEIKTFSDPNGDAGFHNPNDNSVNINIHEEAAFDDFFETIDTITHELAHHYQATLVERLEEGLLTPGDPEYKQALMLAANSGLYDFIDPEDDDEGYRAQPLEVHAWKTGGGVQDALREEPTF